MLNFSLLLTAAGFLMSFRTSNTAGKAIVVVLLIGSSFAWSLMVTKFMELRRAAAESKRFADAYRTGKLQAALLAKNRFRHTPLLAVYNSICNALEAMLNPADGGTGCRLSALQLDTLDKIAEQTLTEQAFRLEKHMGVLATAVTAAPFLGLLGTVWGVMDAFGGLAITRTATLSAVAPGISGALLTTVVGLMVALPSAIGYNFLTSRIRGLSIEMERFAQELLLDISKKWHCE